MDSISGANGIVLVALLLLAFFLLPILFSFLIWVKNQKVFLVAYVGNIVLALIIFLTNVQIVFFSVIYQNNIIKFMPYAKMLTITEFALIIASVILRYKKYKIFSNVSLNLSTGMGLILFMYLFTIRY